MLPVSLHSKDEIAAFLRQKPWLHIYHLGDLGEFFWPYTVWYASKSGDDIDQLVLLYTGLDDPVLLAVSDDIPAMHDLLRSIMHLLPRRIYSHLSEGVAEVFADYYHVDDHGPHYKMLLKDRARLENIDTAEVVPVSPADRAGIEHLFEFSYPGNWFDPRMLETGCYYGVKRNGEWLTVAGVHVYSPEQRVAALGNITTHPDFRGQGLAKATSAKLCIELARTTDSIGLNVKADNAAAIACYEGLGFAKVANYGEYMLELKSTSTTGAA